MYMFVFLYLNVVKAPSWSDVDDKAVLRLAFNIHKLNEGPCILSSLPIYYDSKIMSTTRIGIVLLISLAFFAAEITGLSFFIDDSELART
jgi:hypothetical protein